MVEKKLESGLKFNNDSKIKKFEPIIAIKMITVKVKPSNVKKLRIKLKEEIERQTNKDDTITKKKIL